MQFNRCNNLFMILMCNYILDEFFSQKDFLERCSVLAVLLLVFDHATTHAWAGILRVFTKILTLSAYVHVLLLLPLPSLINFSYKISSRCKAGSKVAWGTFPFPEHRWIGASQFLMTISKLYMCGLMLYWGKALLFCDFKFFLFSKLPISLLALLICFLLLSISLQIVTDISYC